MLGFSFFLSANASDEPRYSNGYNLLFNVKGAVSAESGGSSEVLEGKFGDFFFGEIDNVTYIIVCFKKIIQFLRSEHRFSKIWDI